MIKGYYRDMNNNTVFIEEYNNQKEAKEIMIPDFLIKRPDKTWHLINLEQHDEEIRDIERKKIAQKINRRKYSEIYILYVNGS